MGWWKKLKGWQKGGLILGSGHFIFYSILLFFSQDPTVGESGIGFFLIIVEMPWLWPLGLIFDDPLKLLPVNFGPLSLLIYGTFAYALYGIVAGAFLERIG